MDKQRTYKISDLKISELTPTVIEITKLGIGFDGNYIPNSWFSNIIVETESGKIKNHLLATIILSEICYWYRATEIRDPDTGKTLGWKKKFEYHKLIKSYIDLSNKFGHSKIAVKRAVDLLIEIGLITREIGCLITPSGQALLNTIFLEPIPERVKEITYSTLKNKGLQKSKAGLTNKSTLVYEKVRDSYYTTEYSSKSITPDLQSDLFLTPPSGKESKGKENLKVIKNPQPELFKYYTPTGNKQKQLLEVISNPDHKIIDELPNLLNSYETLDEIESIIDDLLNNSKLPKHIFNKLRKLELLLGKGEKEVLLSSINVVKSKNKGNSLSYLWGVVKKNQGIS